MTAQDSDLREFSDGDLRNLRDKIDEPTSIQTSVKVRFLVNHLFSFVPLFGFQDTAKAFLRDFNPNDVVCVNFFATSVDLWQISQPIRDSVIQSLSSNDSVPVRFSYTITRNPPDDDTSGDTAAVVTGERIVNISGDDLYTRQALIRMLEEDIYNPDYV